MPIKSLKNSLYIFIAAILAQAFIMGIDSYFHHQLEISESTHRTILALERTLQATLVEENNDLLGLVDKIPLTGNYQKLNEIVGKVQIGLTTTVFEQRNQLYTELATLTQERRSLHHSLNQTLPSLLSSVRYIHEHHIAYLQNILSRGKFDQDYDTGKDFKRSPVSSAPELDIIETALAIQVSMVDIFETFSKLERGFSPADIKVEFKKRIQTLYQMTNKLEDFSLDAQDGLLVEELLLNGRNFEDSFNRFLAIEKNILDVSAKKDRKQQYLTGQLHLAKVQTEKTYRRIEGQIEKLRLISLLTNAFMLVFLFLFGKRVINSFRRTVEETERLQHDLSYQIPIGKSDFLEFETIFSALNSMADTINTQVVKLEESRNMMEGRVEERTRKLSKVNQQLIAEIKDRIENEKKRLDLEAKLNRAEKMEVIGTLAGGVAHDLNNILSAIIAYPDLILMDLPEQHPLREPLLIIKSSGERAAIIVEDLLTLARRGVIIQEPVELNTVVEQFINSPECAKILFNHPAVTIKTQLMSEKGLTRGSQVHLSKSIMNLVSNAAEAMHDGGVILITTSRIYIDFTIRGYDDVKEGEYLKLTVTDSGEGIAAEDMEKIFEPFFTRKQMGRSGTGLGMAVVWGTVKDHGGYIDVDSEPGKGSTFTLYFPMSRDTLVNQSDTVLPAEKYRGRGETVLVVDDGKEQRDIAERMLEKLGYRVTCVSSGEKAVEYLEKQSADILLLDMIMPPGINGLETYRHASTLVPGQKAVIASGFSESALVVEAQQLGAGPYIKKPYDFEQIGLVIRAELDRNVNSTDDRSPIV